MWIGKRSKVAIAALALVTLLGAACGDDDEEDSASGGETEEPTGEDTAVEDGADTPAAGLRAGLTSLLEEHVYLAALATGAALRGDNANFEAYAAALNGETESNSSDLIGAITGAYGADIGAAFGGLWRSDKHIPQFVAYTQASAKKDQAGKDAAVAQLTAYAGEFGTTLNSVNENLPADVVTGAVTEHAKTLLAVIDAQAAGDQPAVYANLRMAYMHMGVTAKALAGGTAAKFPEAFPGKADSPAADLRAGLTALLEEHVFLASSATGAAIGGRMPQFEAAAAALNGETGSNSFDIIAAVGSVYGADIGAAFGGLWRSDKHIPQFVAYTQGAAGKDEAKKAAAVAALTEYATEFGTTLNSVNENLPAEAVTAAIVMHATTLIGVIDAQAAGDPVAAAKALRAAVQHMSGTASVLAGATVAKFPEKF